MIRSLIVLLACAGVAHADELRPRANAVRVEHRAAGDSPSIGPARAPVTAELFFVPGQSDSNKAYGKLVELQARHPRRLRVVFRVITRLHSQLIVPIASLEAYAQGKFEPFMDLLAKKGTVRRDQLPAIAVAAGMDPVRLERALDRAQDPELPEPLPTNERRRLRRGGANVPELLFNGVPVRQPLSSLGDVDKLEPYYQDAYESALELIDRGVPLGRIVEANERRTASPYVIDAYPAGPVDDPEPGFEPREGAPPLAKRPLDLRGLPAIGPDAPRVEVVVLCNLRYVSCRQQLESIGKKLQDNYPDEVRLVWYPWYDAHVEGNEDAATLHAAALCAEAQGLGWKWIDETLRQVMRGAGEGDVDRLIDTVSERAEVDRAKLDACIARGVRKVDGLVAAATAAGVHHGPAFVIGGRVFIGGFNEWRGAAPFVDAELAPGLLERLVPHWTDP